MQEVTTKSAKKKKRISLIYADLIGDIISPRTFYVFMRDVNDYHIDPNIFYSPSLIVCSNNGPEYREQEKNFPKTNKGSSYYIFEESYG